MEIDQTLKRAMDLHRAGQLGEAEALYRQVLAMRPDEANALHLLGQLAVQVGRHDVAADLIGRAVAIAPNSAVTWSNLANAFYALGQWDQSIAALRRAVELRPDWAEAHNDLGAALHATGDVKGAAAAFGRAVTLRPDYAAAWRNLGNALFANGEVDQAMAAYGRAVGTEGEGADEFSVLRLGDLSMYLTLTSIRQNQMRQTAQPRREGDRPLYLGERVVLLRCDRGVREALRQAGLHGGYLIDPKNGADGWLNAQLDARPDGEKLAGLLGGWVEIIRNQAAMGGLIPTIWMAVMPEALVHVFRQLAGSDLIEAGDDGGGAEGILARLEEYAVAPPSTEGKIFAVVSIRNGGAELLAYWLEHYTRLGVDKILVGVFDDVAGESALELERCAGRWKFERFVQHWGDAGEIIHYEQKQTGCRLAGALPGTWIVHTDLDEFQEYPVGLREIVGQAGDRGRRAIYGRMIDRVAADGSLPSVKPFNYDAAGGRQTPSLWEQFPVECKLTEKLTGGAVRKVMAARFGVRVSIGHHAALNEPAGTEELGYRVAHFRWHGELLDRVRWAIKQGQAHPTWKSEARKLLALFDGNNGRINLNDPSLEAMRFPASSS